MFKMDFCWIFGVESLDFLESDEWWHRRDQAPIQLKTLSPVAAHGLLAEFCLFV
jgi:hypothetical protein